MKYYFTILSISVSLCSCNNNKIENSNVEIVSLKELLKEEIDILNQQKGTYKKTVTVNGVIKDSILHKLDWEAELTPIISADFSKESWKDYIIVDSVNESNTVYTFNKSNIPIKKAEGNFKTPMDIKITKSYKNFMYKNEALLHYISIGNIDILVKQKALLGKENVVHIQIKKIKDE